MLNCGFKKGNLYNTCSNWQWCAINILYFLSVMHGLPQLLSKVLHSAITTILWISSDINFDYVYGPFGTC